MRFKAKAGERFVVVPATMNPLEKDKKFWLRVYFDCEIYKVDLRRVDLHENCKCLSFNRDLNLEFSKFCLFFAFRQVFDDRIRKD